MEVSNSYYLQPFNYSQFYYDRRSSFTRVLHAATWDYFTLYLPDHFIRSPKVVKKTIMTDINDLVQEFWRASIDGANGEHIFAMCRLREILQRCLDVRFFCDLPDCADKV